MKLKDKGDKHFPTPRSLCDIISRSRNLELGLEEAVEAFAPQYEPYIPQVLGIAKGFFAARRRQALVDYDDLLFMGEELLREHVEVRRDLERRWKHLLVDEYQDTNAVQARLVALLAGEHNNVMVVGDDAQSIYAFRGARLQNILEFPQKFPGARLVKLERNYRSSQPILDLTNQIIAQAHECFEKQLFTEQGGGSKPRWLRPRDERAQSREVLKSIQELLASGVPPERIAVLFRAGNDSSDLEVELTAEGLAYVKVGGLRFLEASHIKDVLSHLRIIANPQDFLSWQRVLMLLPGLGPKKAQQIMAQLALASPPPGYVVSLRHQPQAEQVPQLMELALLLERLNAPGLSPLEATEAVLEYFDPLCRQLYENYPRRLRDLEELPGLARNYGSLTELIAEVVLELPSNRSEEQETGRLTLSTIHSAKGLEWDHVFVIWLGEGRLPAGPTLHDPQALEEERRLLYVACTRARQGLTLLSPREYYSRGQGLTPVRPCRFLEDLDPGLMDMPRVGPVFNVPPLAPGPTPTSRGSQRQNRPYVVGSLVAHASFGQGKVMGYKGDNKILVHFGRLGLKILLLDYAKLEAL
ncbi:DNA helicase II / ATP-dependent DNA helicase PcrA [Desulfarculales bacterium]